MRDDTKKRQVIQKHCIDICTSLLNIQKDYTEEADKGTGKQDAQVKFPPHEGDGT